MAVVTVEQIPQPEIRIADVKCGQYFIGRFSGAIHVRTLNGSVRLDTGMYYTVDCLNGWGPVSVIPADSVIRIEV